MSSIVSPPTLTGENIDTLSGKKVFVMGAGSGMGAAIARMAARRGAQVAIAGRTQHKLDAEGQAIGDRLLSKSCIDAADTDAVAKAVAAHAPFDHMVITAGDLTFAPLVDLSRDDIDRMLASKFWGPINLGKAAASGLASTGSLLFVSGFAAYRPSIGSSVVGALNLGLESLAQVLSLELKPRRVNVISPGVVDSPLWATLSETERESFYRTSGTSFPAGRVGTTDDIAHAAISVIENGFITGSVIHADGGARLV